MPGKPPIAWWPGGILFKHLIHLMGLLFMWRNSSSSLSSFQTLSSCLPVKASYKESHLTLLFAHLHLHNCKLCIRLLRLLTCDVPYLDLKKQHHNQLLWETPQKRSEEGNGKVKIQKNLVQSIAVSLDIDPNCMISMRKRRIYQESQRFGLRSSAGHWESFTGFIIIVVQGGQETIMHEEAESRKQIQGERLNSKSGEQKKDCCPKVRFEEVGRQEQSE